jgi:glycosyltransferase involved in cell wall biosynthesis
MQLPGVTILLPVLNEEDSIGPTLDDLLGQDYAGTLEVVVADGMSTDRTRELVVERASGDRRLRLVDNPLRRQAPGLNTAASVASGEVLVRADGHSRYAPDYVSASVSALAQLGGAVGGRMSPVGVDGFSRAVASAMDSPLTMGPARFHHADGREEVDTVYLGAFTREDFEAIGGFRAFPSGSSEDADFYYRWRRSGRRIHIDPGIVSSYTPRRDPGSLWRQYWRYGQGKAEMFWANGRFPSWRPLAPMTLVVGLAAGLVMGLAAGSWLPLLALGGSWLLVLAVAARGRQDPLLVMLVAGLMHLAYGIGGLWGALRGPWAVRALR